ncbi:hypothetical protein TEA_026184 [Camellia sinensis var. sinensis]|uniref:Uncharacterized protein n=1 Tax=Camellia sinensis var. sinensis TaxID=542762 RepID=A0A4S4F0M3_CAMSN|nr:hypothetical protein TEA_026184 [Camellia sinensis var. sinensis]
MYAYHARGHILMNQILGITRHGSLEMKIAQRYKPSLSPIGRIPEDSFSNIRNCIGIARGFMHDLSSVKKGNASLEVVLLSVPDGYHCVDLCLYKESQIVLLLNESTTSSESSSNGCMMIVQASALPFVSISRSTGLNCWNLHELKVKLCNKEGLKASSIALTALAEYTGFGFGTTPTFGQSTSASAGSSFFGTALSSFGDQNSFLGSQSTTPTFGTTGFEQSVFCNQHGRSRVAACTATAEVDDGSSAAKLESISAMTINKDKSHEELRATCSLMCCFLFSGHGLIAVVAYYWRLPSGSRIPSG